MTDKIYAAQVDAAHATTPTLKLRIRAWDETRISTESAERVLWGSDDGAPTFQYLWLPAIETWDLATVRLLLHELAAWLPTDAAAIAGIEAKQTRRGRPPTSARARARLRVDTKVRFWVSARQWRAECHTAINEAGELSGTQDIYPSAGEWSEPMAAALMDLTARSPFPLARIEEPPTHLRWTSRADVTRRGADDPNHTPESGTQRITPVTMQHVRTLLKEFGFDPRDVDGLHRPSED